MWRVHRLDQINAQKPANLSDFRSLTNGRPFTVAGVAPAGFQFPVDNPTVQLWSTLSEDATVTEFSPLVEQRGARVIDVLGRLKPAVTADQARLQTDLIAGSLARQYPDENKNVATTVM